jgi:Asp-tRNA(Asn)/Glu-tRNA(Gln) amidotransferase A subunit family amidase
MTPLALGSQTGGSIIVPASFCGVYGYKSSPGAIDRAGYRHCKPSLDSIGFFARCIDDLVLLRRLFAPGASDETSGSIRRPRVGFVTCEKWEDVDARLRAALRRTRETLCAAGAEIAEVHVPGELVDIDADFGVVNGWEARAVLKDELRDHRDAFNAFNRRKFEAVMTITREDYGAALERTRQRRAALRQLVGDCDALLTPSAPGEAIAFGPEPVPDEFAKFWSLMQLPAVNLPLSDGAGLPLGLQIIGARGGDDALLSIARWVDDCIAKSQ